MLWRVAAVEATTLLGGVLGMLVMGRISEVWVAAVVGHAGGGFLFLAAHAVMGEIFKHHKALVLTSFAIGLGIIGGVALLVRLCSTEPRPLGTFYVVGNAVSGFVFCPNPA